MPKVLAPLASIEVLQDPIITAIGISSKSSQNLTDEQKFKEISSTVEFHSPSHDSRWYCTLHRRSIQTYKTETTSRKRWWPQREDQLQREHSSNIPHRSRRVEWSCWFWSRLFWSCKRTCHQALRKDTRHSPWHHSRLGRGTTMRFCRLRSQNFRNLRSLCKTPLAAQRFSQNACTFCSKRLRRSQ